MKIVVAGAAGFIGQALVAALRADRHDVRRLVRTAEAGSDSIPWNPTAHSLAVAAMEGADVVINLAGENIAAGRWSRERCERIRSSRVDATATLTEAVARMKVRPQLLVNASAVGIYGDRSEEELGEQTPAGQGFLSEVCREWEAAAAQMAHGGVRVVVLRFGAVLARDGGALRKMLPLFRLGLGGRLGSGRQWMSWVTRDDAIGVVKRAIEDPRYSGPINVVAPAPVTNAEFTSALARALRRPAVLSALRWALHVAFGQMADEALLASTRAVPARLRELGYPFQHPTLHQALPAALQ